MDDIAVFMTGGVNDSAVTMSASSLSLTTPLPRKRLLPEMISASTQTEIFVCSTIDLSNAGDDIEYIDASNPASNRNSYNVDACTVVFTQESPEVIL